MERKEEANSEEAKLEKINFRQQIPLLGVRATQHVPVLCAEIQSQRRGVSEVPLLSWLQGRRVKHSPCSVLL